MHSPVATRLRLFTDFFSEPKLRRSEIVKYLRSPPNGRHRNVCEFGAREVWRPVPGSRPARRCGASSADLCIVSDGGGEKGQALRTMRERNCYCAPQHRFPQGCRVRRGDVAETATRSSFSQSLHKAVVVLARSSTTALTVASACSQRDATCSGMWRARMKNSGITGRLHFVLFSRPPSFSSAPDTNRPGHASPTDSRHRYASRTTTSDPKSPRPRDSFRHTSRGRCPARAAARKVATSPCRSGPCTGSPRARVRRSSNAPSPEKPLSCTYPRPYRCPRSCMR